MPLEIYPIGVFGEMYQYDQSNTIAISQANVWYTIDTMTAGELQEVEFQNGKELKILRPGRYFVGWKVCMTNGVGNLYKIRIAVNGTTVGKTQNCGRKVNAGDIMNSSSCAIIDLAENDIITLEVMDATTADDPVILDANVSLHLIE